MNHDNINNINRSSEVQKEFFYEFQKGSMREKHSTEG